MAGEPSEWAYNLAAELLSTAEALPVMREACAAAAFMAGQFAGIVETPVERELLQLWLSTLQAEASVLDLLAGLLGAATP